MAKKKARTTGYDRLVEDGVDGAMWTVGTLWFVYVEGSLGINLFLRTADGLQMLSYARDLKEAGYFAEGFAAGLGAIK